MKKCVLLLLAFTGMATVVSAQARFGIKAGVNIANQKVKLNYMGFSGSQSGDAIVSFHFGGVAEVPLGSMFAFRPELLLSGKGSDLPADDGSGSGSVSKAKVRPFYLEMPLNLVFRHTFPTNVKLYAGAGPSLAYGIFGKAKANGMSDDVFADGGYKRFDFGFNLLGGVELRSGVTLSVNYIPGMANLYGGADVQGASNIKFTNSCVGFSLGYMF